MRIAFLTVLDQNHGHTERLVRIIPTQRAPLLTGRPAGAPPEPSNRWLSLSQFLDLDLYLDPDHWCLFWAKTQPVPKFMETNRPTKRLND